MTANRESRSLGLIEMLLTSLGKALRTCDGESQPAALLWTDSDGQWQGFLSSLRLSIPELYTLGAYDSATKTGPAIWLKCVVDRVIPEQSPPLDKTPILYLPNVSRQLLRAADCPPSLQPLIELQHRGSVWHQRNGRDWTVEAFLVSEDGLALDVAQDSRTREAMVRALPLLAETSISSLRGHRLEAEDFDKLAVTDPVRDVLRWLSNPDQFRATADEGRWRSFCNVCKADFNFDPEEDGVEVAADNLQNGSGRWSDLWQRFSESPRLYPGIPSLLRDSRTLQGRLALDVSRSPRSNDEAEAQLRSDLETVAGMSHHDACTRIMELEKQHAERREWVWTQLDDSPLAVALEPLTRLATLAEMPLSDSTVDEIVKAYVDNAWRCDWAAMETLALSSDVTTAELVSKVVAALYRPWLDASARRFQELVIDSTQYATEFNRSPSDNETCVMFVDGLRYDIANELKNQLLASGLKVDLAHRLAPLPTVTATAKPLTTAVCSELCGTDSPDNFTPVFKETKQLVSAARLRAQIAEFEFDLVGPGEIPIPTGSKGGAWVETGQLDDLGHKLGTALAHQIKIELARIADRAQVLLNAGWRCVRIVTDHGWLLLPGGLPKVELPHYLVASKWARCAMLKGESSPSIPIYPWYWNPHVRIASPHGIASFQIGHEYAHGGVSLQECVVPEFVVERGSEAVTAEIINITWRGMRCRVSVKTNGSEVRVDLRAKWKQPETSIVTSPKDIVASGETSLVIEDDSYEGTLATLVIIDNSGNVLAKKPTTVGEAE